MELKGWVWRWGLCSGWVGGAVVREEGCWEGDEYSQWWTKLRWFPPWFHAADWLIGGRFILSALRLPLCMIGPRDDEACRHVTPTMDVVTDVAPVLLVIISGLRVVDGRMSDLVDGHVRSGHSLYIGCTDHVGLRSSLPWTEFCTHVRWILNLRGELKSYFHPNALSYFPYGSGQLSTHAHTFIECFMSTYLYRKGLKRGEGNCQCLNIKRLLLIVSIWRNIKLAHEVEDPVVYYENNTCSCGLGMGYFTLARARDAKKSRMHARDTRVRPCRSVTCLIRAVTDTARTGHASLASRQAPLVCLYWSQTQTITWVGRPR